MSPLRFFSPILRPKLSPFDTHAYETCVTFTFSLMVFRRQYHLVSLEFLNHSLSVLIFFPLCYSFFFFLSFLSVFTFPCPLVSSLSLSPSPTLSPSPLFSFPLSLLFLLSSPLFPLPSLFPFPLSPLSLTFHVWIGVSWSGNNVWLHARFSTSLFYSSIIVLISTDWKKGMRSVLLPVKQRGLSWFLKDFLISRKKTSKIRQETGKSCCFDLN